MFYFIPVFILLAAYGYFRKKWTIEQYVVLGACALASMVPLFGVVLAFIILLGYSIFRKNWKTAYYSLAAICSVFAIVPFGYSLAHGGGFLLYTIPAIVFAIFLVPLVLVKVFSFFPSWLKACLLVLPVVLIVCPLLWYLLILPKYQEYSYKKILSRIEVSNVGYVPIVAGNGGVVGYSISYHMKSPENFGQIVSCDYGMMEVNPIEFPTESLSYNGEYIFYITEKKRTSTNNAGNIDAADCVVGTRKKIDIFVPTNFDVELYALIAGVQYGKDGVLCRTDLDYQREQLLKISKVNEINLVFKLTSRADMSNRMGTIFETVYESKFPDKLNGAEVYNAVQTLPMCVE